MDLVPDKVSSGMLVLVVVCSSADMVVQLMLLAMNIMTVLLMYSIEMHIATKKTNTQLFEEGFRLCAK